MEFSLRAAAIADIWEGGASSNLQMLENELRIYRVKYWDFVRNRDFDYDLLFKTSANSENWDFPGCSDW